MFPAALSAAIYRNQNGLESNFRAPRPRNIVRRHYANEEHEAKTIGFRNPFPSQSYRTDRLPSPYPILRKFIFNILWLPSLSLRPIASAVFGYLGLSHTFFDRLVDDSQGDFEVDIRCIYEMSGSLIWLEADCAHLQRVARAHGPDLSWLAPAPTANWHRR